MGPPDGEVRQLAGCLQPAADVGRRWHPGAGVHHAGGPSRCGGGLQPGGPPSTPRGPPARGRGLQRAPAGEPDDHAIGRSRGGLTTWIRLAADARCITAGQAGDAPASPTSWPAYAFPIGEDAPQRSHRLRRGSRGSRPRPSTARPTSSATPSSGAGPPGDPNKTARGPRSLRGGGASPGVSRVLPVRAGPCSSPPCSGPADRCFRSGCPWPPCRSRSARSPRPGWARRSTPSPTGTRGARRGPPGSAG